MTGAQGSLAAGRTRRLRFAVGGPMEVGCRADLLDHARLAESLGFDVATFPDHLFLGFDPLVAMTAAASATERIRIGALVINAGMRNPVVLAKELASVDVIADGRLEVGIGAGWADSDFEAAGIPFPSAGTRIEAMEETVEVLRGVWSGPGFSFRGKHHSVALAPSVPAPIQIGGPPIMMGGGGRRVLSSAGRLADVVTIAGQPIGDAGTSFPGREQLAERVDWVTAAADSADRAPEIHLLLSHLVLTDRPRDAAREFIAAWPDDRSTPPDVDAVLESPFVAIGPRDDIADRIRALREEFGISYFSVRSAAAREMGRVIEVLAGD